jgi:hypothetical protein
VAFESCKQPEPALSNPEQAHSKLRTCNSIISCIVFLAYIIAALDYAEATVKDRRGKHCLIATYCISDDVIRSHITYIGI